MACVTTRTREQLEALALHCTGCGWQGYGRDTLIPDVGLVRCPGCGRAAEVTGWQPEPQPDVTVEGGG